MKMLRDLEMMKNVSCKLFENQYKYLFRWLEDYYISKSDRKERIKNELEEWDKEDNIYIVNRKLIVISLQSWFSFR